MKVLLIWEEIPGRTRVFLLEGELAELAIAAHGQFVNYTDEDMEALAISDALEESSETTSNNFGKFESAEINLEELAEVFVEGGIFKVVTCGFYM